MAFGRQLDAEDSKRIRDILGENTTDVTFYPTASGMAEYEELAYQRADGTSEIVNQEDPRFQAVFALMLEHDYPAEFNDKFFVQLTEAGPFVLGSSERELRVDPKIGTHVIRVDGEEIDHADSPAEARRLRDTAIYGEIGTETNTTIERRS